jgi:pimeloyl-ACP methyl ester carboxylesterase
MSAAAPAKAGRWILLRGWSREARHWGDFADVLSAALEGARVHATVRAVDLPGTGLRFREASPMNVAAIAQACRAEVLGEGAGPVHVVAMSMGAMVALAWARAHPAEIASLVLVNTSARGLAPFWHRLRPANYPLLLKAALSRDVAAREARVLAMTSHRGIAIGDGGDSAMLLRRWEAIARGAPVSPANALRQLVAALRFEAPPAPPPVPLLLLASRCDGLVSVRCSQRLAQRWNVPLALHPWAGHDLPLDDPAWVAQQVAQQVAQKLAHSPDTKQ